MSKPFVTHVEKLSPYVNSSQDPQPRKATTPELENLTQEPLDVENADSQVSDSDILGAIPGHVSNEPLTTPRPRRTIKVPARFRD